MRFAVSAFITISLLCHCFEAFGVGTVESFVNKALAERTYTTLLGDLTANMASKGPTVRLDQGRDVIEPFNEEDKLDWGELPAVFIIPLDSRFNDMLLNQSCKYRLIEDFVEGDINRPGSEYDQDVFFHWELLRYAKVVDDPYAADLFYVPFYWVRRGAFASKCSKSDAPTTAILNNFRGDITWWLDKFPPAAPDCPRFFMAAGSTCSCSELSYNSGRHANHFAETSCNPLSSWPKLASRLRILAWEPQPPCDDACRAESRRDAALPENVVYPYHCTGVEVHRGDHRPSNRSILVLDSANHLKDSRFCTHCSVCNVSNDERDWCPAGCYGIRRALNAQVNRAIAYPDAIETIGKHFGVETVAGFVRETSTNKIGKKSNKYKISNGRSIDVKKNSIFCLEPFGDTMTRRSFYEDIIAGCIPVVFRNDSSYLKHFAFSDRIPYASLWVYIPEAYVRRNLNVVDFLARVPLGIIRSKQALLRYWAPALTFEDIAKPRSLKVVGPRKIEDPRGKVAPSAMLLTLQAAFAASTFSLSRLEYFSQHDHQDLLISSVTDYTSGDKIDTIEHGVKFRQIKEIDFPLARLSISPAPFLDDVMEALTSRNLSTRHMKVIGVGHGTTATHSLFMELCHMGFRAWHFGNRCGAEYTASYAEKYSLFAKRSYDVGESTFAFASRERKVAIEDIVYLSQERTEALVDSPVYFIYDELREVFPDAFYVLTVRNSLAWAKSRLYHHDNELVCLESVNAFIFDSSFRNLDHGDENFAYLPPLHHPFALRACAERAALRRPSLEASPGTSSPLVSYIDMQKKLGVSEALLLEFLEKAFSEYNAHVRRTAPTGRLLEVNFWEDDGCHFHDLLESALHRTVAQEFRGTVVGTKVIIRCSNESHPQ